MNQIEEYREAMDSLGFSDEGKERIMKNLMEQEGQSIKGKHFRPLRPALIAACVCLALVGTVFAAGWDWAAFVRHDVSSEHGERYGIDSSALTRYSWDDLAVEECSIGPRGLLSTNHPSWEDAEQYLGLEMPMSQTVVEQWSPRTFDVYSGSGGDRTTYDCRVQMANKWIMTEAAYQMEQWYTCVVNTYVLTDKAGPDYSPVWIMRTGDVFSATYENYVTPGGLETGIISDQISNQNAYAGIFVRDGIGYYVHLSWNNTPIDDLPESQSHGLELLKQVLNGFVLE